MLDFMKISCINDPPKHKGSLYDLDTKLNIRGIIRLSTHCTCGVLAGEEFARCTVPTLHSASSQSGTTLVEGGAHFCMGCKSAVRRILEVTA